VENLAFTLLLGIQNADVAFLPKAFPGIPVNNRFLQLVTNAGGCLKVVSNEKNGGW